MKIYIDFDGTLFNTDKYTKDYMNIFSYYHINSDLFDEVKTLLSHNSLFNINKIIDYLIKNYNIDKSLKEQVGKLLNNSYIYPDVKESLNNLIDNGYELYLLTYGDKEFQSNKIDSSNITNYFKDIIITNKNKSELNLDYNNSIFIDNSPYVIDLLNNCSTKKLIRIKRDDDRYSKLKCNVSDLIECNDFYEIVKYLKGGFSNE